MTRVQKALAALYAAIGIVTFGHASADRQAAGDVEFAECRANPKALCFRQMSGDSAMAGMFAAPLWPLYWSWVIFEEPCK